MKSKCVFKIGSCLGSSCWRRREEGRQLDVALTLRSGFRRAWTMHLAGGRALRPSAASARACGAWSLSLRKGAHRQNAQKRITCGATATEYSPGCATGMLGDFSGSARRALPPTNMLFGASLGPFIVHLRAQTLRACAFRFLSGAVRCCRSSLSPCRCPVPFSCQGCQRLGILTSAARALESGESAWHA